MKKRRLTKEEIRFIIESRKILKSQGINLTDDDINEGLLGAIGSIVAGGAIGGALYWWLSDDAADVMDDIKDKMEDILDASKDLLDTMEDLYGEIENSDVKSEMEKSGASAAEKMKSAMSEAYDTIKAEMEKVSAAEKEGKEEKEAEKEEEKAEAAEAAGGAGPMALAVMSAAVAKVLTELFADKG